MQEDHTVVTVLMTVYNGEKDLARSLQSVLDQTLEPGTYEVVVVDDGSTDNTGLLLQSYAERYTHLRIVRTEHVGRAKALNLGLRFARGNYIAINDCDDESLPNRLEVQLQYLNQNPDCVLVAGWARVQTEDGEVLGERRLPIDDRRLRRLLAIGNPFIHSTVVYRKEALHEIGGFNERQLAGVDYDAIERLARIGKLGCVPHVVGIHVRSDRQYFRKKVDRWVRWRDASEVAVRAAFHNAWWLLPMALLMRAVASLRKGGKMIESLYRIHNRLVRGGLA